MAVYSRRIFIIAVTLTILTNKYEELLGGFDFKVVWFGSDKFIPHFMILRTDILSSRTKTKGLNF